MNNTIKNGKLNKNLYYLNKARDITSWNKKKIFKARKFRASEVHRLSEIKYEIEDQHNLLDFLNRVFKNGPTE